MNSGSGYTISSAQGAQENATAPPSSNPSAPAPAGDYVRALDLIGQLLCRVFMFNEVTVVNADQFAAKLETDTRRRFRHRMDTAFAVALGNYFDPRTLAIEAQSRALIDPEETRWRELPRRPSGPTTASIMVPELPEIAEARESAALSRAERTQHHERLLAEERLSVLQVLLRNLNQLPTVNWAALDALLADLRAILAETHVRAELVADPPRLTSQADAHMLDVHSQESSSMSEHSPSPESSAPELSVLVRLQQQIEHAERLLANSEVPSSSAVHLWIRRSRQQLARIYGSDAPEMGTFQFASGRISDPREVLTQRLALIRRVTSDLRALPVHSVAGERRNRIFIGHGRSALWRHLKDFIADDLGLPWDEFNREPTAGYTTTERLNTILGEATFAFLVMTGEDEHADSTVHARENVVHEVGLFQGRLGTARAIALVEDGCTEFSNIHGLTQIRFPRGDLSARFEEIRRVLKREGLL